MTTPKALGVEQRTALLDELTRLRSDADQLGPEQLMVRFLPLASHERALSRDAMVVRGERGAGKSMLFSILGALESQNRPISDLFPRAQDVDVKWVDGFSERGTEHPLTDLVGRFVENSSDERLRVMWMAHLIARLARDNPHVDPPEGDFDSAAANPNNIESWVAAADANLASLTSWLDRMNQDLTRRGEEVVIMYDHLDKIGTTSPRTREKAAASLLALWLSLSNRYSSVRAKIFVREDLFEASLSASADASKLRARSVALTWDIGSLYRLLIRQMAALSENMRDWLEDTQNRVPLTLREPFGWFPPETLKEKGRPSQAAFVEHLAGSQMGKGVKKGYVYNWIPNRLQDARGAIVPRSLLNLVAYAAEHARTSPLATHKRLLHPKELQAALEKTSKQRVDEIGEEQVVVYRLESLRGTQVPIDSRQLVERLSTPSQRDDSFGNDGNAVAAELERIGVLRYRGKDRWDVPDIYRYGYGIKRKGGAPRP